MPTISLPTPGVTPGPGWANQLNTAITEINDDIDTRLSDTALSAKQAQNIAEPGPVRDELNAAIAADVADPVTPIGSALNAAIAQGAVAKFATQADAAIALGDGTIVDGQLVLITDA